METLHNLAYGFSVFLDPVNLMYCFFGVLMGTLVGVLPGLGPAAAISLLLPTIFYLPPIGSVIMLSGICYGAMYGGSTTSILVNIPGETASVVTCIDGYQMARNGRAGPALGIAAFGSWIAGTFGIIGLMLFAPTLANAALSFGPQEYFSLSIMSLTLVTYVSRGPLLPGMMMACFGIIISMVGMDPITSTFRFTFGRPELSDGFTIVLIAMGMFGMGEVFTNLNEPFKRNETFATKIKDLFPSIQDWKDCAMPITRASIIGFFLGILPGFGTVMPTFLSYALEKKLSKHPEKFGTGVIEGVAAPEAANNAASSGTFIPLLSLGLPTNPSTAIILGALLILGLQPGPLLISNRPDLFWGVIASMYVGNIMLLILNLPLVGLWVKLLKIPYSILYVLIIMFCQIGAYSLNNNVIDVFFVDMFGLVGFLMRRYEFEGAPMVMGLVLGPVIEKSLRRSLLISSGSPLTFLNRPISAFLLLAAIILVTSALLTKKKIGAKAIETQED